MTAEIALLNRKAVALAADSIVTITDQNNTNIKTYDSAEKIFELSRIFPLGLMTYNSTEFLQVPIEILVREFRKIFDSKVLKIDQIWPNFHKFLQDESKSFTKLELDSYNFSCFANLLSPFFEYLEVSKDINSDLSNLNKSIDKLGFNNLKEISVEQFNRTYSDFSLKLADSNFPNIKNIILKNDVLNHRIQCLVFKIIKSNYSTPGYVGLVFTGFGTEERFPSLSYVEIDGFYFGKCRVVKKANLEITRDGHSSLVIPFAQKIMFDRFVSGLDDEYEKKIQNILCNTIHASLNELKEIKLELKKIIYEKVVTRFCDDLSHYRSKTHLHYIRNLEHLPNKEMAEYASSLVELSTRHHRYSSGIETVGGPIDVAILTKNEGFIWVKRKKYFDLDLNPSYSVRRKISFVGS